MRHTWDDVFQLGIASQMLKVQLPMPKKTNNSFIHSHHASSGFQTRVLQDLLLLLLLQGHTLGPNFQHSFTIVEAPIQKRNVLSMCPRYVEFRVQGLVHSPKAPNASIYLKGVVESFAFVDEDVLLGFFAQFFLSVLYNLMMMMMMMMLLCALDLSQQS